MQVCVRLVERRSRGHEIDFVWTARGGNPMAIEWLWSADNFDAANLEAFRRQHPQGDNVVLAADVKAAFQRNYGALKVRFEGLDAFVSRLTEDPRKGNRG
jgi:hypothetical protein